MSDDEKKLTVAMIHGCLDCDGLSEAEINHEDKTFVPQSRIDAVMQQTGLDAVTAVDVLKHNPELDPLDKTAEFPTSIYVNGYIEHYQTDIHLGESNA